MMLLALAASGCINKRGQEPCCAPGVSGCVPAAKLSSSARLTSKEQNELIPTKARAGSLLTIKGSECLWMVQREAHNITLQPLKNSHFDPLVVGALGEAG